MLNSASKYIMEPAVIVPHNDNLDTGPLTIVMYYLAVDSQAVVNNAIIVTSGQY